MQLEYTVLGAYQQELDALLANWMGYSSPFSSLETSPLTAVQTTYSMTPPSLLEPHYKPHAPSVSPSLAMGKDPLYVLDRNTGETIPANVTLNTFSTWSENLLAQVSGATVSSYSWNVSQAPDLTNVSGTTTSNLQGTWANFTGSARTDTISVTETPQSGPPLTQTMTFEVAGTNSPAFSSSRPTSSSTWPTVLTPDQLSSGQATQEAGSYASIGLADGAVHTAFSMPSYNPNTTPVSLDYSSTAANAQPIFLAEYQLPTGQSVPATISARLTFNGTALATVTYNTSGLNPGDYVQIALQANATSLSTGRYPWSITVTNSGTPTTYSGNVDVVNQANSPYGAGWSLDNVEQLVSVSGGVMLVNPDGTSLYFASNGQGGYNTSAGDFSTLTVSGGVYTRTLPDGTKINFNSSGQQTSVVDRDGNTTTFGYSSGKLTTITDMNNQVTTLTYNSSGLLSGITDPASRTATLTYTGKQLTSITDPANDVWQYSYDSANDLTKLTDPNNHATTFTYNSADRVSSVTLADNTTEKLTAVQMNGWAAAGSSNVTAVLLATGDQAQFTDGNNNVWKYGVDWLGFGLGTADIDPLGDAALTYRDVNGLAWMSADALGRRMRDFFDGKGNPTETVQADDSYALYQYNNFGEVTQYTDPTGSVTTYSYNSKGDQTQKEDALLHTWTYTYNAAGLVTSQEDPLLNTTSYGYNALNELTSVTNALNQTVTNAYNNAGLVTSTTDAMGYTSTFAYDAMNRLTGKTLPDSSTTNSVYSYSYDKVGNQTSVTDPLNHTTSYGYNAVKELVTVTNALNQTTTYGYDANGNQTTVTNPLSQTTTNTYNAANELVGVTNALNYTYTYTYDAAGEKTSVTNPLNQTTNYGYTQQGQLYSVTDPLSNLTTYGYDAAGDQTSINQSGPGAGKLTTSVSYNALHQVVKSFDKMGELTQYSYDADGNQISVTDPLNDTTTYTYNALNRLVGVTNALNNTTTYTYDADGNKIGITNALNKTTTYTYDRQGRVLTETAPNGGVTTNSYDAAGNLQSLTDPDNYTTSYSYNAINQLVGTTNPMGYQTTNAYNAAGLLTSTTDADGRTITYGYDAIGDKTSETWVGGNYTATYQYNGAGQLTQVSDPYSTYTYTYDNSGRVTSVSNAGTPGVPTVTLTYTYDDYGDRTSLQDSLGAQISYSYDNNLRMTMLSLYTMSNHSLVNDASVVFSYNGGSLLTGVTEGQITSSRSYDKANELTNITDTTGSTTLANYTYGYNSASQMTSYQDNNSSSLTYGYDANGELTSASGTLNGSNYSVSYSYDANGNRTMSGYTTSKGNELTSDGTYKYTYDNNGNTLTQTNIATGSVTYYTWDYRNRLIEVKQETSTGTVINDEKFTYDVNDNRIAVSLNGTTQLYTVYDGDNPYIDFNGSGALTQRYLTNPDALNQFYGQVNASGTVQWFVTDNISSIRQVVSASGGVLDTITYDPYGNILNQTNSANAPRFLYTGGSYDSITGNDQFDARYYNPGAGRFVSQDPAGFNAGDADLYRYVFNAPTNSTDPTGLLDLNALPKIPQSGPGLIDQINGMSTNAPLFAGSAPVYGMDGNQNAFAAMSQAGQLIQKMTQTAVQMLTWLPGVGVVAVAANSLMDVAQGNIGSAAFGAVVVFAHGNFGYSYKGGNCFAAGTPLLTPSGEKAIELFRTGDLILSRSERDPDGEVETKVVEEVFVRTAKIVRLQVGGRVIATTSEHPFWVKGKGWQTASELQTGDWLSSQDGRCIAVEYVRDMKEEATVYNLRISDYHTYFVGSREWDFSIWAHNADYASASRLIGVTDSQAAALGSTLRNIQVEGRPAVSAAEAFGSRAGSTFRGRPPTPTSDLDVFVTLLSDVVNSPDKLRAVMAHLKEIESLFTRATGIPLQITSELDTLAQSIKQGLQVVARHAA